MQQPITSPRSPYQRSFYPLHPHYSAFDAFRTELPQPPPLPPPCWFQRDPDAPSRGLHFGPAAPTPPHTAIPMPAPAMQQTTAQQAAGPSAPEAPAGPHTLQKEYREFRNECLSVCFGDNAVPICGSVLGFTGSLLALGTILVTGPGKLTLAHPATISFVYSGLMLNSIGSAILLGSELKGCCTSPEQVHHRLLSHSAHNSNKKPWPHPNCDLRGSYNRNSRSIGVVLSTLSVFIPMGALLFIASGKGSNAAILLGINALISGIAGLFKLIFTASSTHKKPPPPKSQKNSAHTAANPSEMPSSLIAAGTQQQAQQQIPPPPPLNSRPQQPPQTDVPQPSPLIARMLALLH